ncbi:integrase [Paracoccus subflavus]|uniref:Integrase n=1 Tax=Paracoccus subflavus TaxID=2528244 RepID=A0A4V2JBV0_9RHOB|nr:tyrosine-type recombinase/integrase [Paracoccus subflavus]TBN37469.1 integrase [Paracoccus subflavus]
MAGQVKNLKVKGGRFYARVAVPAHLRAVIGKTELVVPLGGERRAAMKALPAAVATLQRQIDAAGAKAAGARLDDLRSPITTVDYGRAVWSHYQSMLASDDTTRAAYPTDVEIEAEKDEVVRRCQQNGIPIHPIEILSQSLDWLLKRGARDFDQNARQVKLDALRGDLTADRTHLVEDAIDDLLARNSWTAPPGSAERKVLARQIMRAEIEALERTLERDRGDYGGQPSDPIVKAPAASHPDVPADPVPIKTLFKDYIAARQALGKHKDGAGAWETAILHLIKFLGHADARRITKRNLLDWRDKLLAEGRSTKTIADKYLASVRAMLRWAFENDRLPTNEAEAVRQEVAKKQRTRERGYTTREAVEVLKASTNYQPKQTDNPANRESAHITAAKRWLPILCAFTGARVAEMAQLRKEDLRQEGNRWVIRVTPDAGSVKAGGYRDVPLHQQVIVLGFIDFVKAAKPGPLFHVAKTQARYLAAARATAGRVTQWLQEAELVPAGIQPSHGWRHRFKTQARELGLSDRIVDAIQGHASKTASDDYGDVSVKARIPVIDALPDYKLA